MKEHLYTQALGGLDEPLIEAHLTERDRLCKQKAQRTRRLAASAACAALVAVGIGVGVVKLIGPSDTPVRELGDVAIPYDHVAIHYLTPDGRRAEVTQYLSCDAVSIFTAWRTLNALDESVHLIQTHTASNGEESYEWIWEYEGEGGAHYRPGDKFCLTITVAGLEPYLDGERGDALLESLKTTLSGYTGLTYERVEVVLK